MSIKTMATRVVSKTIFKLKKHSPEILLAVGIGTFVATVVTASRATLKLDETIFEDARDLARAKASLEDPETEYTQEDYNHDALVLYSRMALSVIKLYALPVALGSASIACFIAGHTILDKRNAALTGALVSLQEAFKRYRERVVENEGKEADAKYCHGFEKGNIETPTEDGKGVKIESVNKQTGDELSPYARIFDENSRYWQKTAEYNYMFIKRQQSYANELLKLHGHVFLNEVYDMLDIPRSQLGALTGWVLNGDGDGFIDFGLTDFTREKVRDFVNGYERSILLDFNVDGVIYNLI